MNKKEFYRELMLNYTVDTEKVKRIAKRRIVKRGSSVLRWVSGTAACAAVTAAAVTIVSLGALPRGDGEDIDMTGGDAAAFERLEAAEQYYTSLPDDAELMDMYVSFEHGLSYNEVLLALSAIDDDGDIRISLLYTEAGEYYANAGITAGDDLVFFGAKVTAPASMCKEIRMLRIVSLVELSESGITDDTFRPFGSSELVTTTEPVGDTFEISIPHTSEATEETTPADTDTETDVTDPEVTTDTDSTTTLEEAENDIEIPVSGVATVNIISADRIVVTTSDSIRLYRIREGGLALETTFYASNAKISWSSYDGADLFITACDGGSRNRLYWADGRTGSLTELDISAITSDAEISSVICTPDVGRMVLKTVSADNTRIYAGRLESTLSVSLIGEYDCPVTSLALTDNTLYLAFTDTMSSTIRIASRDFADGNITELASYSGTLRCTRSQTFDAAALTFTDGEGVETCILLTPEGTLVETQLSGITFSLTDGSIFTDGENYYCISGSRAEVISYEEAATAFAPAPTPGDYTYVIQEDGSAYLMLKVE